MIDRFVLETNMLMSITSYEGH